MKTGDNECDLILLTMVIVVLICFIQAFTGGIW